MARKDCYSQLGIDPGASQQEIVRAYQAKLSTVDPEQDFMRYRRLQRCYDQLRDPSKRRQYDRSRGARGETPERSAENTVEQSAALKAKFSCPACGASNHHQRDQLGLGGRSACDKCGYEFSLCTNSACRAVNHQPHQEICEFCRSVLQRPAAWAVEFGSYDRGNCHDFTDTLELRLVWAREVADPVSAAPVIAHGFVYFPTLGGDLYAFTRDGAAAPGMSDGGFMTRLPGGEFFNQPVYRDGKLFVVKSGGIIQVLDALTRKSFHEPLMEMGGVAASAVLDGDRLVVGTQDGRIVAYEWKLGQRRVLADFGVDNSFVRAVPFDEATGTAWFLSMRGLLAAVNLRDGGVGWRRELDDEFYGGPVRMRNGDLAMCSTRGIVTLVSAADASIMQRCDLDDAVLTQPACDGSYLYLATASGRLGIVEPFTGAVNLRQRITPSGSLTAAPLVLGCYVMVTAEGGALYAVDSGTGRVAAYTRLAGGDPSPPGFDGARLYLGSAGYVYCFSTGPE